MSVDPALQAMANKLAEDCIAVQDKIGEERLFMELGTVLGAASQTLEEAFITAVRTRMAERQGRAFLAGKLREFQTAQSERDTG